jgi:L-ascorbate 6-phosphate lactonase
MNILFIGQGTFRLTLPNGTVLLTDPWFTMNPVWRAVPPAFSPDQIGSVHFLLCSHNHLDHIDKPSLRLAMKQDATVIGSVRIARRAGRFGINKRFGLKEGEQIFFDGFSVKAVPAFHPFAEDAIGFLIEYAGRRVYYSGDTRLHPDLISFLTHAGRIDLAFLQIACARYFGRDDGLNLATAAELARAFSPRIVVPMHFHGRFKEADPTSLFPLLQDSGSELLAMQPGREVEVFLDPRKPYIKFLHT